MYPTHARSRSPARATKRYTKLRNAGRKDVESTSSQPALPPPNPIESTSNRVRFDKPQPLPIGASRSTAGCRGTRPGRLEGVLGRAPPAARGLRGADADGTLLFWSHFCCRTSCSGSDKFVCWPGAARGAARPGYRLAELPAGTHTGMALDHLPLRMHRSMLTPRTSRPSSQSNVTVSPIL